MNQEHIFIDLETSSLNPKTGEIIELAAIRTDCFGTMVGSPVCDKIKPLKLVDAEAAKVNGYSEKDWQYAVPFRIAFENFERSLIRDRTDKLVIVAHFADFDRRFLEETLDREQIPNPLQGRSWIDTGQLAWPLVFNDYLKSRSLEALCKYYGIENEHPHSAADDVKATAEVYWAMMGRFKIAQGVETKVRRFGTGILDTIVQMASGVGMQTNPEESSEETNGTE